MIYVTGDTHGDLSRFDAPALKNLEKGDTLIICGDFGFVWDNNPKERKLLRKLGKKKYNICFVDGTHENFELLNSYPVEEWCGGKTHCISGNLRHMMRGQLYTIDSMKVFTMGGGESPDIDIRYENNVWEKAELPTKDELMEGAENIEKVGCNVDFIITHEPPAKIKSFLRLKDDENATINGLNTYFDRLSEASKFRHWFFGSMHLDKFVSSSHICVFKNIINPVSGEILR